VIGFSIREMHWLWFRCIGAKNAAKVPEPSYDGYDAACRVTAQEARAIRLLLSLRARGNTGPGMAKALRRVNDLLVLRDKPAADEPTK